MDAETVKNMLKIGETIAVEFKRCGNGIESDVYESVCAFLNRFGGDLFLGVLDDGTVSGVPENSGPDMVKNFISCVSNPALFSPTIYLAPEILHYEGKTIIHVHIMPSAEVHSYKRVIYDRVNDSDVKVTATAQIAQMYIRKQDIFTEKKIFPYVKCEDLRLDLLPKLRIMATNAGGIGHPWNGMTDEELLKSARLYGKDRVTGKEGFNLAAVMLLGKDDVILDVSPAYVTDALLRKENTDRYDDREIIKTNLIESYERLMEFGRKHLPDKFFLEQDQRKNLRDILTREMIANTLIHREYTSAYQAKFVIEKDRMYVENANRAAQTAVITAEDIEPNPKNPIIAAFFRNIGYADQLGSGVRNLFKYSKFYSGQPPQFMEGDVFRIVVPLDEKWEGAETTQTGAETTQTGAETTQTSAETTQTGVGTTQTSVETTQTSAETTQTNAETTQTNAETTQTKETVTERILCVIREKPSLTQAEIAAELEQNLNTVKYHIRKLREAGRIERVGTSHQGKWIVK